MNSDANARIFISYSHRGNGLAWKEHLIRHLAVFEKHNLLDVWHDDETKLGEEWHPRINAVMGSARLAVLLLTDEFLKSPFVLRHELPELQRRHKEEGLIVAPILCEKCDWEANAWLASLQIKPRVQATPVSLASFSETDRERTLRQLATEIAVELGDAALAESPARPVSPSEFKTYLDKFPLTRGPGLREEKLIGREQELALLDLAFAQPHTAIVSLVAWGGVGKTMLVKKWLQGLEKLGWFGARRVYAWSFYSQGTKEDRQASEDTFLAHALEWFGVQCEPTLSPWDKGRLLADAVARERTLLILDGIEPLQYPPGPMGGQLRAPGVQSLLKQLARKANAVDSALRTPHSEFNCLCLVTTREPLTDLADFQRREGSPWGSVLRVDLGNLTDEAGAALLHHAGANRAGAAEIKPDDKELLAASREVDGHALTLNLLGRFLARAHGGDIYRRDLVKFEEADRKERGGTTFKMLAAFEDWFAKSGEFGARQLAILRILGLFDRPADPSCLNALRSPPRIPELTGPLFLPAIRFFGITFGLRPQDTQDWNATVSFLVDFGLVRVQDNMGVPMLDCHPLIREHFTEFLQERSVVSWRTAHRRLYEHLCASTPDKAQPTIEDLQPLYQAIAHGCQAGLQQEASEEVYWRRIARSRQEAYSVRRLGAFGADLAALACFFERPWSAPSAHLSGGARAALLGNAAFHLRALGRLTEAIEPMQLGLEDYLRQKHWRFAAMVASNLSEIRLALGAVAGAVGDAEKAVTYADHSGEAFVRVSLSRPRAANAMCQAGRRSEAEVRFREAEEMQNYNWPEFPLLHSDVGFMYCDLLLDAPERGAWQNTLSPNSHIPTHSLLEVCLAVSERTTRTLKWAEQSRLSLLSHALDHLTLSRAALYEAILRRSDFGILTSELTHFDAAMDGLRRAGVNDYVVCGLLTHAWLRSLTGVRSGAENAIAHLDEAWDIAERGPMRLHMADIHLYRARLFFREKEYPWREGKNLKGEFVTNRTASDDLAAAEKLINECGYHRRDEELADAKRAILGA